MIRTIVTALALSTALVSAPAYAQEADNSPEISVGGTVVSQYVFSDLYVQIDSPTAQVWASIPIGETPCSVDLFAAQAINGQSFGSEADIGASCTLELAEGIEATALVSRYILTGITDITTFEASVAAGDFDLSVTQYVVDGPEADATKIEAGYTLSSGRVTVRPLAVAEYGFGLPDIYVGGVEGSVDVGSGFSLDGAFYTPLERDSTDPRRTQWFVGLSWNGSIRF